MSLFELGVGPLCAAFALTAVAAWVQGTIGLGFAIVTVPVLSLVDDRLAPAPQILIVLPLTIFMVLRERRSIRWRGAGWVLLGRLPGLAVGIGLLSVAAPRTLDVVIGALVLAAAGILAGGLEVPRNRWTELSAGVFSGASGVVSAIGGPPVALLYRNAAGPEIRSTLAGIFMVGVSLSIAGRAAAGGFTALDLEVAVFTLPALAVGLGLSRWSLGWVEGPRLRRAVLVLATAAATALVFRGLYGQAGLIDKARAQAQGARLTESL